MSEHTPGPWVVNHNSIGSAHIESEREHGWANNGWIIAEAKGDDPERQANACLIAAAPELLEALKFAQKYSTMPEHAFPAQLANAIEKAIAKAEGK